MKSRKRADGSKTKDSKHHRSKYVDQSKRFFDKMDKLGLDKTYLGRLILRLDEHVDLMQFSALFLFCFALSLLVFLNFEIPINLKEGDVAKVTVKSPLSFEMVDELATEEKRVLAERNVSPVFDFDSDLFDRLSANVFDAFSEMRTLMNLAAEPGKKLSVSEARSLLQHKEKFEEKLGQTVRERAFEWLVTNRFSEPIENAIIHALESWLEKKIVDHSVSDVGNVMLRIVPSAPNREEINTSASEFVDLSRRSQFVLENLSGLEGLSARDRRTLTKLSYGLLKPNVTPNRQETAERRKRARESVLPVVIAVKKNQVIISEGTVVQPVHILLQQRLRELQDTRRQDFRSFIAALLFVMLIMVSFSYLKRFSTKKEFAVAKDVLVMGLIAAVIVVLTKSFLFMTNAAFTEKLSDFIHPATFLFAAPVAAGPMLVGLVVASGEVVWLFTVFLAAVLGLMVEQNFSFFIVTMMGGMSAVVGVFNCKKRNDIYWAGVRTGIINSLAILLFMTMEHFNQPDYFQILLLTVPAGFISGILSSMVTMILIPIIESTFNYTTDIRLLELSNLNHPLLKKMLIRAPGTYHHSMMVGSLVEAAAEQIGANPLLGKVMSYYHDIGKMEHAEYFIENQRKGNNPHDQISPYMSRTILIAHVKDGAELGLRYNLGKPIIDGILQHHGTGLISYFYNKALQQVDEHCGPPSEEEFRYPGPKPQFKEAALVMLADGIEAAARALDEPTPIRLQNIVRNIIQRRFMEAQLDECNLTLRDLSKCEAAFNKILLSIYHQRIDYPKNMGGAASEKPEKTLRMLN